MYQFDKPYNDLPLLPPCVDFDDVSLLKLVNKANNSLYELKGIANVLPNRFILISPLTVREAVSSSGIENINTTVSEALKADVIYEQTEQRGAEKEILRYRDALMSGFLMLTEKGFLNLNSFIKIQSILEPNKPGVRKIPGTSIKNSVTKQTIYTPPEGFDVIMDKLKNFDNYFNDKDGFNEIDPLIRMAVMHYQFEAIHPFHDGNGRTGRIAMILYLVLTERLELPILFLSKYILENRDEYYARLNAVTTKNEWKEWVYYILKGVDMQAQETRLKILEIKKLINETKEIAMVNNLTLSQEMINYLFSNSFYSQKKMVENLHVHRNTSARYFQELENVKILSKFKYKQASIYYNEKFLNILSY
ncbi:MAG: Filamentation induced by cAMP protein Fic [Parcubacteria group bacterium GW2011_GWE2_38_18]|nr:MAG: Filamentation induced by cAMP protein Fic [Parcubacteria group bacterium GW2011_GWE2_38_18]